MKISRICLVASAGGHLSQLLKLGNAWETYDVFYVSTLDSAGNKLRKLGRYYITGECNRNHPLRMLKVLTMSLKIIRSEKPNVIISTGAAPGLIMCLAGKLFGSKIIWADSIANVEHLSLSGRIMRPFANLVLSQWPEVAGKYRKVEFVGTVV
jgi:UDP-N-acetylglucosamine:LPS N-acetylglucosamine transferase